MCKSQLRNSIIYHVFIIVRFFNTKKIQYEFIYQKKYTYSSVLFRKRFCIYLKWPCISNDNQLARNVKLQEFSSDYVLVFVHIRKVCSICWWAIFFIAAPCKAYCRGKERRASGAFYGFQPFNAFHPRQACLRVTVNLLYHEFKACSSPHPHGVVRWRESILSGSKVLLCLISVR